MNIFIKKFVLSMFLSASLVAMEKAIEIDTYTPQFPKDVYFKTLRDNPFEQEVRLNIYSHLNFKDLDHFLKTYYGNASLRDAETKEKIDMALVSTWRLLNNKQRIDFFKEHPQKIFEGIHFALKKSDGLRREKKQIADDIMTKLCDMVSENEGRVIALYNKNYPSQWNEQCKCLRYLLAFYNQFELLMKKIDPHLTQEKSTSYNDLMMKRIDQKLNTIEHGNRKIKTNLLESLLILIKKDSSKKQADHALCPLGHEDPAMSHAAGFWVQSSTQFISTLMGVVQYMIDQKSVK